MSGGPTGREMLRVIPDAEACKAFIIVMDGLAIPNAKLRLRRISPHVQWSWLGMGDSPEQTVPDSDGRGDGRTGISTREFTGTTTRVPFAGVPPSTAGHHARVSLCAGRVARPVRVDVEAFNGRTAPP